MNVQAEEVQQLNCKQIGAFAAKIMQVRQVGVPMSDSMAVVKDRELYRMMVMEAYEVPSYGTDTFREREVNEFRNKWELICYTYNEK